MSETYFDYLLVCGSNRATLVSSGFESWGVIRKFLSCYLFFNLDIQTVTKSVPAITTPWEGLSCAFYWGSLVQLIWLWMQHWSSHSMTEAAWGVQAEIQSSAFQEREETFVLAGWEEFGKLALTVVAPNDFQRVVVELLTSFPKA